MSDIYAVMRKMPKSTINVKNWNIFWVLYTSTCLDITALFSIMDIIKTEKNAIEKHVISSVMVYCAHISRNMQKNEGVLIKNQDSKYSQTSTYSKLTPHLLCFQIIVD